MRKPCCMVGAAAAFWLTGGSRLVEAHLPPLPANNSSFEADQALLILTSDQYEDTRAVMDALEDLGAHATHVIPPRVVIAHVPAGVESFVAAMPTVREIHRDILKTPPSLDAAGRAGVDAWNALRSAVAAPLLGAPLGSPLTADALDPPPPKGGKPSAAPDSYQTSEFMIGRVAVGVILPESIGNGENWTAARRTQVFNEIVAGLDWWAAKGGTRANLTFVYDQRYDVPTQYEPINRQGVSDQSVWVADILAGMGYASGDHFSRVRSYINSIRGSLHTDWCVAYIVVDSYNDTDGKFADATYFAWAYLGGPYIVMTYDNDGWGIGNMDYVAKHELGHTFLAGDEYCSPGYACCNFGNYGYLSVSNGNCEDGNPASVGCVMKNNTNFVCPYTEGQLGWRDSDADGLPDPIDNVVANALNAHASPTGLHALTFTGSASDVAYDSPTRRDTTINRIASVKYRVDEGPWLEAEPTDGAFDTFAEGYRFTTLPLPGGTHRVETQAFATSGNGSIVGWRGVQVLGSAADLDGDGDVDGADFGVFASCLNGSGVPALTPPCSYARLDEDEDVDGEDFGVFAGCFNGSGNPPNC